MDWLIYVLVFIAVISLSGMLLGYIEGGRKHRLEIQKEERRLIEARTKEIEAQNRRAELDYQSAMAELERFDRRGKAGPVAEVSDQPGTNAE